MRLIGLLVFLFILVSFGLGASLSETDLTPLNITQSIDNANITQIELSRVDVQDNENFVNPNSFFNVIEAYIRFILVFAVEVIKAGIHFGYENPEYYEASFVLTIVKWTIILILISLLIKPITYLIILLILFGIWIKERINKKKNERQPKRSERRN